jgi:hypothetical protein
MGVVAEARRRLAEDDVSGATAEEVVADLENLLKVSVLVARVGHKGALEIADTERRGWYQSVNKATDRPATYLDQLANQLRVGLGGNRYRGVIAMYGRNKLVTFRQRSC